VNYHQAYAFTRIDASASSIRRAGRKGGDNSLYMVRQRKQKADAAQQDIPDEEKWKIIQQTGLLKKIPKEQKSAKGTSNDGNDGAGDEEPWSPLCDEIFNSTLYLIPFSSLYVVMEVYVCSFNFRHALSDSPVLL
jgi:hypothetical protein